MVKITSNLYVPNRQKQYMNIRASNRDYTKPPLLSGTTKPAEKYISIRVNGNNWQCKNTLKFVTCYRINQEIKFLYIKKAKLNQQLYNKHLVCAAHWPTCWTTIQQTIDNILQLETETYYENLNKKLDDLQANHSKRPANTTCGQQQSLYPRTVNLRYHLHKRRTRTTGSRCIIQHTTAPQGLLEQPHRRN
jgi:hypothetical protein